MAGATKTAWRGPGLTTVETIPTIAGYYTGYVFMHVSGTIVSRIFGIMNMWVFICSCRHLSRLRLSFQSPMSPMSLRGGFDVILAYAVFTSSCDGHVARVWHAL